MIVWSSCRARMTKMSEIQCGLPAHAETKKKKRKQWKTDDTSQKREC